MFVLFSEVFVELRTQFCTEHRLLPRWRSERFISYIYAFKCLKKRIRPWLCILLSCVLTVPWTFGTQQSNPDTSGFVAFCYDFGEEVRERGRKLATWRNRIIGNEHWRHQLPWSHAAFGILMSGFHSVCLEKMLASGHTYWWSRVRIWARVYQHDDDNVISNPIISTQYLWLWIKYFCVVGCLHATLCLASIYFQYKWSDTGPCGSLVKQIVWINLTPWGGIV